MISVWPEILDLKPYRPGKPIGETQREYGLSKVVKLASNENPLGPSARAIAAVQKNLHQAHLYPDAAFFNLRQTASRVFNLPGDQITFANGSNEFIDLILRLVCQPGDAVLMPKYTFIAYKISSQVARVNVIESAVGMDLEVDVPDLIRKIEATPKVKIVFLTNPNNPTGRHLSSDDLQKIVTATKQSKCLLVVDEAYFEFVRDPEYASAMKWQAENDHIFVLRTMSKVYGLANLRVGYAFSSAHNINVLDRIRNPFNVGGLSQLAAEEGLQDQDHVRKTVALTWKELDRAMVELPKLGYEVLPSQANFVLAKTKKPSKEIYEQLLKKGVIVRPVDNYGLSNYLRISIGLTTEMDFLYQCLREINA